jgi:hypothetical protein
MLISFYHIGQALVVCQARN